jgi:menaquinone-9 beta-reductase
VEYDAVIVGAGPAGATAGYLLAGAGYDVLILERQPFPRQKLCGGCLTDKTIRFIERIYGDTAESLLEAGVLDSAAGECSIFLGTDPVVRKTMESPFYFVKRDRYDAYFLQKAIAAGASVREGERVVSVDPDAGMVATASGGRVSARHIIGADGIHSLVRQSFPDFDRDRWDRGLALGLETTYARDEVRSPEISGIAGPAVILGVVRSGYAWLFPNCDRIVVGIGGLLHDNPGTLPGLFARLLSLLGLPDRKPSGYPLPYGNYLSRPAYRTALLAGDAGGYADPNFGEGIFYAHRTAELAAFSILRHLNRGDAAAETYCRLIGSYVVPEMQGSERIRRLVCTGLNCSLRLPVKLLLRATIGQYIEAVHGTRSYRRFERIGDFHQRI